MSDRIEELEAELAYYKSELGLATEATQVAKVRIQCSVTNSQAHLLLALYGANGRVLSQMALYEAIPHVQEGSGISSLVRMHVKSVRKKIGADAIRTIPGVGYYITGWGKEFVERCLN